METAAETASSQTQSEQEQELSLWQRIPQWGYWLAGGVVVIFGASVAVRLLTEEGSFVRSAWSVGQLLLGMGLFLSMHLWAFAKGVMIENFTVMDMVAHPLEIWGPSLRKLPQGAWRVWLATWGLTGVICATAIIGGLNYEILFRDWGFRRRAKMNLMQKLTDAARNSAEKGAESLEEAVEDFAGKASEQVMPPAEQKKKEAAALKAIDCVVIGYMPASEQTGKGFLSLVLAAVDEKKLRFVGTLAVGIPDEVRNELSRRLSVMHREKPFVPCRLAARWVQPRIALRVQFEDFGENQQLQNPVFGEQLADLKLPGK